MSLRKFGLTLLVSITFFCMPLSAFAKSDIEVCFENQSKKIDRLIFDGENYEEKILLARKAVGLMNTHEMIGRDAKWSDSFANVYQALNKVGNNYLSAYCKQGLTGSDNPYKDSLDEVVEEYSTFLDAIQVKVEHEYTYYANLSSKDGNYLDSQVNDYVKRVTALNKLLKDNQNENEFRLFKFIYESRTRALYTFIDSMYHNDYSKEATQRVENAKQQYMIAQASYIYYIKNLLAQHNL